jgi:uncharacterized membrane protein
MNPTHIHLLITHLPIFGSLLGFIVLCFGFWKQSESTKQAAYIVFVLASIGAGIAYLTGEYAEETVENIAGVMEEAIKAHEESALYALISLLTVGGLSLINLVLCYLKHPLSKMLALLIAILSIISFLLVAQTGNLGGKIRHTEIGGHNIVTHATINQQDDKNDDD